MSTILRRAVGASRIASCSRTLTSSAVTRQDIVQGLYLREIKAYKAPPVAKDAHVGVVKAYSLPPTPKTPALPADLASELSAYDASEPSTVVGEKAVPEADQHAQLASGGAEAFLELCEADVPPEGHH
ncbi:ATP synthase complex subunit H-domain-containing protein [Mycena pura]|uniref:ATP synthase complex subunit H-domain-containing protein n=1 Tax=Mycena pura TaxID=153505 RepID=A0AAD6VFZ5_9AGAR|nr:ATP synthase complex subunit H-domain-containing protein [Mycena pura]